MSWLSNIIKNAFKGGVTISYSDGKPFDPRDQERTDAITDLVKKKTKKLKPNFTKNGKTFK